MKKGNYIAIAIIVLLYNNLFSQSLGEKVQSESSLSKALKSSGSLLIRESHSLPDVTTMKGNDINCDILILKNLLNLSNKDEIYVGLSLRRKEEYSERSTTIDQDEIDGLISSIELLNDKGLEILSNFSSTPSEATSSSLEVHFNTKDGLKLGVVKNSDKLSYAVKLSSTADWVFLFPSGITTLLTNLKTAKRVQVELQ